MPNRIIKESINESRSLSELSFFAQDLYKRLITYADDCGRFNADYQIMRARLYPRELQIVSEIDIEDALIELSGAGKIAFYTAQPRKELYGCFPKWSEHQRIRDSKRKCPDPEDVTVNDWYLRRFVPINMKKEIIERDSFKCQICGKYISSIEDSAVLIKMGAGLFHIDHIVPVCQGGRATKENLRLTCPKCNLSRQRIFSIQEILEESLKENNEFGQFAASCGELRRVASIIQSESNPNPNRESPPISPVEHFEEFLTVYPCKGNRYLTETSYVDCLMTGLVTEDELVESAKNYADRCKILETEKRYIKKPENFLRDMEYCQYLPGKYEKPKGKSNQFNQFQQNEYDFDELEKDLLNN